MYALIPLLQLDPSGIQVLIGYEDGVVRLFAVETENDAISGGNIYKITKALNVR